MNAWAQFMSSPRLVTNKPIVRVAADIAGANANSAAEITVPNQAG